MPELPDVELFRRLVDQHCLGRIVATTTVSDPASLEGVSAEALQRRLKGRHLTACRRHGKVLFAEFGSDFALAVHFGTNGSLQWLASHEQEPRYVRLSLAFADGSRLAYLNPRRIGHVQATGSTEAFVAAERLGPDALDPSFNQAAFDAAIGNGKQAIKATLMDQGRIAGIGNIYADEILFQARLNPAIRAGELDPAARRRLFEAMKLSLQTAIDSGAGAESLVERLPPGFLLPQRRQGGRCPRCGTAIEAEKRGGRTGYYCPKCQPEPAN
jgi:formamidopyrimidine-DNA glycosylase